MSNFSWQISFCNSFNKYITFFFLIRLRFPKSQSISNILCRIYSQSTLKRIRKLEKLDYRLPSFLNFRVSIQSLKASLTYKQCQLEHLEAFQNVRNDRHSNMSFIIWNKKQHRMSFLDVKIIREDKRFTTTVYRKPSFSGV